MLSVIAAQILAMAGHRNLNANTAGPLLRVVNVMHEFWGTTHSKRQVGIVDVSNFLQVFYRKRKIKCKVLLNLRGLLRNTVFRNAV